MSRFKGARIWPLNPRAMDEKTSPSILYTLVNQTREKDDDDYHSNEEDCEQQWIEHVVAKQFINISSIIEITSNGLYEDQCLKCYVNMPKIPIITKHAFVIE